jgi:hypothetical protein
MNEIQTIGAGSLRRLRKEIFRAGQELQEAGRSPPDKHGIGDIMKEYIYLTK